MSTLTPSASSIINDLVRRRVPVAIIKIDNELVEGDIKFAMVTKMAGVDLEQVEAFVEEMRQAGFTYRHSKDGFLLVRSRVEEFCERYGV